MFDELLDNVEPVRDGFLLAVAVAGATATFLRGTEAGVVILTGFVSDVEKVVGVSLALHTKSSSNSAGVELMLLSVAELLALKLHKTHELDKLLF